MNWAAITGIFFASFIKFMFAPFAAKGLSFDFYSAWITVFAGGLASALIFYFGSEYFMRRAHRKKVEELKLAAETGEPVKMKKNFTWVNKRLVVFKHTIGQKGLCLFAPLFLSVPLGSIVCAKFFGHKKSTFPLIVSGLILNSFSLTVLAYKIF